MVTIQLRRRAYIPYTKMNLSLIIQFTQRDNDECQRLLANCNSITMQHMYHSVNFVLAVLF